MNTEQSTTTEQGTTTEQVRYPRADRDARLRQDRRRALPAWLASRGNRRALALLPVIPLTGGVYAGTLGDTMVRSVVLVAVAATVVAGILLLRRSTRLLDAVPDRLLDEREIGERDHAYRRAHGLVAALTALLALVAIADGTLRKVTGSPLVPGDGWIAITLTAMLVSTMMPAAVLAWRFSEPFEDTDD